jgi:outer membrane protein insertion porin family
MQLSSRFLNCLKTLSPRIPACLAVFFCLAASSAFAAEQNTAFIPFKINAPHPQELMLLTDEALQKELAGKKFTMLPRDEARGLVDYSGTWPPPAAALGLVAEKTGFDYVAVGTVTQIAGQLSIDIQVFDLLAPGSAHSSYRGGVPATELATVIRETLTDILNYTSRDFLVASITPEGNKRIDSGAILRKVTTKPGDMYDPVQLRSDLKSIFSMGYFDNVEIEAKDSDKGKNIIFRVIEKPVIKKIIISGTDELEETEVRDAAGITPNSILNQTRLNEAVQRINELYKSKGYYNTVTTAAISYPSENQAEVTFRIEEGEKIFIGEVLFEGNESFSKSELKDVIETSAWNWLSWITETGVLKMDILKQDAIRLGAFYNNNGFLEVKVADPVVVQKEDELFITFRIEEGPRYRVGTVNITGDLLKDKEELLSLLKIRDEEFLNRQTLRNDALKLTDMYAEQGYAFAEIHPKVDRAADSRRVDIIFQIDKGPLVYFNRVEVSGNTRTRDNVIRRDLEVREGGLFDSKAIRQSTENLQRLGHFEEVSVIPQPTLLDDQMDVQVNVKEKSTGQFSIGAGYSSSDSLMFMAEVSEDNLLGTGNRLALAANISSVSTRYNLSFTNPRILDSKVLAGFNLFNWRKEYDDYTKDSTGGGVNLGHSLIEKWRINYGYSYTDTELSDVSENAALVIRLSEDINISSAVRVSIGRDSRNSLYNASSGSVNTLSVEYAGGPFGGDAEFTKLEGSTSWFFPLPLDSVFHVKGSAGQAFDNGEDKLPVYERFYLGGLNSIRGFETSHISPKDSITGERIGGDKMWFTNFEIIFPLFEEMGLKGVVFTDFGNVYAVEEDWDFSSIKKGAGIGFRWLSPVGPLRLEWGYNLDPDDDEDTSVWDFSIGGAF